MTFGHAKDVCESRSTFPLPTQLVTTIAELNNRLPAGIECDEKQCHTPDGYGSYQCRAHATGGPTGLQGFKCAGGFSVQKRGVEDATGWQPYTCCNSSGSVWIGAKERHERRGNFQLSDGSDLSIDHPAWANGHPKVWPTGSPPVCVAYMPGLGIIDQECDFDLSVWGSKSIVCEETQAVLNDVGFFEYLSDVTQSTPSVADRLGGTELRVTGVGFEKARTYRCQFTLTMSGKTEIKSMPASISSISNDMYRQKQGIDYMELEHAQINTTAALLHVQSLSSSAAADCQYY